MLAGLLLIGMKARMNMFLRVTILGPRLQWDHVGTIKPITIHVVTEPACHALGAGIGTVGKAA